MENLGTGMLGGLGVIPGLEFLAGLAILWTVILVAAYIFVALALMTIAKKKGKTSVPAWFAWVPILNVLLMLDIAGLPLWYLVLFIVLPIIPFIGALATLALGIYVWYKIAEAVKKPGWYALLMLIPIVGPFVGIGLIAWGK